MKRILSLILALIICLSVAPVYAEDTDVYSAADEINNMVGVLKMLNIVDTKFTVSNDLLTRGQFASLLVKARGMNTFLGTYEGNSFIDITAENEFAKEITLAKDMNLISGYNDGTFKPDNNITVLEAAICFIRVLGYNVKADALGGYPAGYYEVIRETKLLNGINKGYSENLTMNDAVKLIFNALHTKILYASAINGGEIEYNANENMTLIYSAFGYGYTDGIVEGIDRTNLFGENDLPYYSVYIGDEIFYTGPYFMREMLGCYVRAYHTYENGKDTIKFAYIDSQKNSTEIIKISDIVSIENGIVKTEDNDGKEHKYSYELDAAVIYNGINSKEAFSTDIYLGKNGKPLKGTVKLLNNNNDKKADVIFVDAYDNIIVGRVDNETGTVVDYKDVTKNYILDTRTDNPYVIITDETGAEMEFGSLTMGTSLVIYESQDNDWQKYIEVYASKKEVTGKIVAKESTQNVSTIDIETEDGVVSYILSDYAKETSPEAIVGRKVALTLNIIGEIARISYAIDPGDYQFAMLCQAKQRGSFETDFLIKLMDETGNFVTFKTADKYTLDNNKMSALSENDISTTLQKFKKAAIAISEDGTAPADSYYFQMIKYGLNKDGEINYIDTVLDENGDVMTMEGYELGNEIFFGKNNGTNTRFQSVPRTLGLSVIVNEGCKVYMYPSKGKESDSKYYGIQTDPFESATSYPNIVYFQDDDNSFDSSVFMRQYVESEISGDLPSMNTYIVTKVTETVNADGELAKKWYVYDQGVKEEVIVSPELKSGNSTTTEKIAAGDVKVGDIIYFTTNKITGEVEQFLMMYSHKEKSADIKAEYTYATSGTQNLMIKAEVLKTTSLGVKLLYKQVNTDGTPNEYEVIFNNVATANGITVFDTKTNKVRSGNTMDLVGKQEDPVNYTSKVVVRRYQNSTQSIREIYIYK